MANSFENIYKEKCSCTDCESGISPIAYMVELLQYAINHIKANSSDIEVTFFDTNFYQPYDEYPFNCTSLNDVVCEVRAVSEVLQRYILNLSLSTDAQNNLTAGTQAYCFQVYQDILNALNTSYPQIRLMQYATNTDKAKLAQSLKIPLTVGDTNVFSELFLDYNTPANFTEDAIERRFGMVSTKKNIFSTGVKEGDNTAPNQCITKWSISGIKWGINTDENGWIYVNLTNTSGTTTIDLFNNSASVDDFKIASGTISTDSGEVLLVEVNNSGLSADFFMTNMESYISPFNQIKISVVPEYLSWRLAYLRSTWLSDDNQNRILPIIDPDIVTGSDVYAIQPSRTIDTTTTHWVYTAADLWRTRLSQLNTKRSDLVNAQTNALIGSNIATGTDSHGIALSNLGDLYYTKTTAHLIIKNGSTFIDTSVPPKELFLIPERDITLPLSQISCIFHVMIILLENIQHPHPGFCGH